MVAPGKAYILMKWFRKRLKGGSRLALFALAIQFALSFGHFHGIAAQAAPAMYRPDAGRSGLRQGRARLRHCRPSEAAAAHSRYRSTTGRCVRDLRRHGAGQQCAVRDAAAAAVATGRRTSLPDHRRRVRPSGPRSRRVPVPRSSRLLTSIDDAAVEGTPRHAWPVRRKRAMRNRSVADRRSRIGTHDIHDQNVHSPSVGVAGCCARWQHAGRRIAAAPP